MEKQNGPTIATTWRGAPEIRRRHYIILSTDKKTAHTTTAKKPPQQVTERRKLKILWGKVEMLVAKK